MREARKRGELLFLGTGGSTGVPMIGCNCSVCTSTDPRNQRLRSAALVRYEGRSILIDAGPDYRQQALRYAINHLDGVMLTHPHYDHIGGMDELRVYYFRSKRPLPCLLSAATHSDLRKRLDYFFHKQHMGTTLPAQFAFEVLDDTRGDVTFQGVPVRYFTFHQGTLPVLGFRFGTLAFVSDIREYPESLLEDCKGVETLVLSALRFEPSFVHLSVDEAVALAERVQAKQTYFVHMAHELDHEKTNAYLPETMTLAHDGQRVTFYA